MMRNYLKVNSPAIFLMAIACALFTATACDPDPEDELVVPKPKAYFRIDFPKKDYRLYDSVCPYSFETPVYSIIKSDVRDNAEPCWINIFYPQFRATIHVSYKVVDNNLGEYLKDSDVFAKKHTIKVYDQVLYSVGK